MRTYEKYEGFIAYQERLKGREMWKDHKHLYTKIRRKITANQSMENNDVG